MQHLILGYGYCGFYLAQELLKNKQQVTALSRHLPSDMKLPRLNHVVHDLIQPFKWTDPDTVIYYLIPPEPQGEYDIFLKHVLQSSTLKAKKLIYFGSSSVYGNHQGTWVNEESPCFIDNPRQKRRLDAEQQCKAFCKRHRIDSIVLRIAGIYGPQRVPIEAAQAKTPIIELNQAPYTNYIFVKDLANIAYQLSQEQVPSNLFNIADGHPKPMGTLQQLVAQLLRLEQAPYETWEQAFARATPMKREFMNGSKRLDINRLKATLEDSLKLTDMEDALNQFITL